MTAAIVLQANTVLEESSPSQAYVTPASFARAVSLQRRQLARSRVETTCQVGLVLAPSATSAPQEAVSQFHAKREPIKTLRNRALARSVICTSTVELLDWLLLKVSVISVTSALEEQFMPSQMTTTQEGRAKKELTARMDSLDRVRLERMRRFQV